MSGRNRFLPAETQLCWILIALCCVPVNASCLGVQFDIGRIPLGYPAANYQPAPNGTQLGGSLVTRRRPQSVGLKSSGV